MKSGQRPNEPGARLERAGRRVVTGTLASRSTGFVRTLLLAAALGLGTRLFDSYNVANNLPNIVFDLLIGGLLTSVAVPILVRAKLSNPEKGDDQAARLLALVFYGLGGTVVLSLIAAPFLIDLYAVGFTSPERHVAVVLTLFFLPQVLFYGLGATMAAVINTRGRFGLPAWAPVANNMVVIAAALLYLAVGGQGSVSAITTAQLVILGFGTTLGIIVQTLLLLPAMRRCGIRMTRVLDPRGLVTRHHTRRLLRLIGWVSLYVLANQIMFVVVTRLATQAGRGSFGAFSNSYLLFQVPYAVVAVSLITMLLPRMSAHGAAGNDALVTVDLSRALRLAGCVLVPTAIGFLVLGSPLATVLFDHGHATSHGVHLTGSVLEVLGPTVLPFAAFQVMTATYYALGDARTPALVNLVADAVAIVIFFATAVLLPTEQRDFGLALGYLISYIAGLAILAVLLHRRLGRLDGRRIVRTHVRLVIAGILGGALGLCIERLVRSEVPSGWPGALAIVIAVSVVGGGAFVFLASHMRITELRRLLTMRVRS